MQCNQQEPGHWLKPWQNRGWPGLGVKSADGGAGRPAAGFFRAAVARFLTLWRRRPAARLTL